MVGESVGVFQVCVMLNYTGTPPMLTTIVELTVGGDAISKSNWIMRTYIGHRKQSACG